VRPRAAIHGLLAKISQIFLRTATLFIGCFAILPAHFASALKKDKSGNLFCKLSRLNGGMLREHIARLRPVTAVESERPDFTAATISLDKLLSTFTTR
jgi:hypothetical protein